jgi:hypothetical protein
MGGGDSDLDSDDDREKKLMFLQEQLKKMQEQLNALVEDSLRCAERNSSPLETLKPTRIIFHFRSKAKKSRKEGSKKGGGAGGAKGQRGPGARANANKPDENVSRLLL